MSQVYMTAKLNLADGTIIYPQISLDNVVKSISDPTLVTVATLDGSGDVPMSQLPYVTTIGNDATDTTIPTAAAVRGLANTKQNTLTEGPGVQIDQGGTISFNGTTLDVTTIMETESNGVHLSLDGTNVTVQAALAANDSAGVIAGAADGVTIENGVVKADVGSGLKIGASTTSDAGKVVIDEASVESTLQDVRIDEGSTVSPVDDQVVTPGNLRGALSVGQAVDVTCEPNGNITYPAGENFLGSFTWANSNVTYAMLGFFGQSPFPKFATGLNYLLIADLTNNSSSAVKFWKSGTSTAINDTLPVELSAAGTDGATKRIALTFDAATSGYIAFSQATAGSFDVTVSNMREYEVTALTDEAIAYIAQLEDPDAFFRSTDAYSIHDKYLVKQDMVCPFIPIISMSNSDLTIAAGLAYQMQLTDNQTHHFTVDTIPTNGYGWDSHLQLFVGDTSGVVFDSPLVLMDPLTPNSGHNITIKWRAGQALAYVDDTDVGYVVTVDGGTADGSLYYGLMNDVGSYIVFSHSTDGTTIDLPEISTINRSAYHIVGNGVDNTTIDWHWLKSSSYTLTNVKVIDISTQITSNSAFKNCLFVGDDSQPDNSIYYYSNISLDISGCTFSNVKGKSIIHLFGSTSYPTYLTIDDCTFDGTFDPVNGILWASYGTITISNSKLLYSRMFLDNATTATFTGNTLNTDINLRQAAGIIKFNGGNTISKTVSIAGGTVNFSGMNVLGGTVSNAGTISISGGTLTSPNRDGYIDMKGAGSYLRMYANSTIAGCTITGWTGSNGVVYPLNPAGYNVNLIDCLVTGNTASGNGGGLCRYGVLTASVIISGSTFSNNRCSNSGSNAIFFAGGELEIHNTIFAENQKVQIYQRDAGYNIILIDGMTCSPGTSTWTIGDSKTHWEVTLRIQAGSLNVASSAYADTAKFIGSQYSVLSVGSYDTNGVWVIGGTASFVTNSGSTVSLSGIGTYVNANGDTDLSFTKNNWEPITLRAAIVTDEELTFTGASTLTFHEAMPTNAITANPLVISDGATLTIVNVVGNTVTITGPTSGTTLSNMGVLS